MTSILPPSIAILFFAVLAGCSPSSPQADSEANTEALVETQTVTSTDTAESESNAGTISQTSSQDASDATNDKATTFLGQDGRERVVPTGPPPTDRDGRLELTFDDLSFEMEKGDKFDSSMLTKRIRSFDGSPVRLRGFIRPSFRQSQIEKFVFVRDDKECCFGPGAAVYDNALVSLKKGSQTDYTVRPVVVSGQLHLKEYEAPDGMILSIYRIKNAKIE